MQYHRISINHRTLLPASSAAHGDHAPARRSNQFHALTSTPLKQKSFCAFGPVPPALALAARCSLNNEKSSSSPWNTASERATRPSHHQGVEIAAGRAPQASRKLGARTYEGGGFTATPFTAAEGDRTHKVRLLSIPPTSCGHTHTHTPLRTRRRPHGQPRGLRGVAHISPKAEQD